MLDRPKYTAIGLTIAMLAGRALLSVLFALLGGFGNRRIAAFGQWTSGSLGRSRHD
jgi:hypothetical protein